LNAISGATAKLGPDRDSPAANTPGHLYTSSEDLASPVSVRVLFGAGSPPASVAEETRDATGDIADAINSLYISYPLLIGCDVEASRHCYTQTWGFSLDWDAGTMISVSRDGKSIMLCQGAQSHPGTWVWIGVEDADVFFTEFVNNGAHIHSPPRNFAWAYEFAVKDPDGHTLRFGAEPKPTARTAAQG
jgi:hypothetical protein